ncbi:MarR family transcriptional regulator [Lactobacillus sp. ESL0680]|uniref:MarR family winged helix-turn-helix transcriptional regulator n=1 Tax=unclassified Lactobacillus TaxID=2620435 RepID=UPI0023F890AB|nr:MarR family transcriptional regulator [Lactobacillus sp. ESL0680]MDF7669189.1 MarR family transcriptional regulator [Lactobacillus sp. ESL0703]WEV38820.1 MarR family transcriptional regulator [Lactobacillus sp. ESL0680]
MEANLKEINNLLTTVYTDIMQVEERELHKSEFKDISIKEVHAIDAMTMYDHKTSSQLAKELMITAGSVTTMVNNLVRKGYVVRIHGNDDRRVVRLGLTHRGRLVYRAHDSFHRYMVKKFLHGFDDSQIAIIERALLNLRAFLEFPPQIDGKKEK